jgi:homoserine O-acetyltransferase/O-succinyltransferase
VADVLTLPDGLRFESGAHVAPLEIAYATYGSPSNPAVYIAHALTGDADAAGWWGTLIGPGKAIDTERFYVVCGNILGGCKGTSGPSSTNPATGERYGLDFPLFTVRDMVTVHRALLAELGVTTLHAAVGGSLGGMQILQWSLDHPDEIERAVLVCATARLSAQNIAFSKVARHAILTHDAMDVARMMAHITYVSVESLRRKFDRERKVPDATMTLTSDFQVEHYLDYQAKIFLERFDPHSYLYLSRVMDYYEPFAEPAKRLPSTTFLLVSFDSDWRFGTEHSEYIFEQLSERGADVRHHEVVSPWGHDSFLMDVPEYLALVRDFV